MPSFPSKFTARRAFFSFMGPEFRFFSPEGRLAFFVKQKAFKLKEELVVFLDEGRTQPALRIKARSIMDVRATYDVTDATTGETVGACKREGLKSMLQDTWLVLDASGRTIARVAEDSLALALLRRFVLKAWLPQTFKVTDLGGQSIGLVRQRFNFFILAYDADFNDTLDPRLGLAATVLLLAIEGRQT